MIQIVVCLFMFSSPSSLSWEDFKATPPLSELNVAARIYTAFIIDTEDSSGLFTCHVHSDFLDSLSWVRVRSESALKHEVVHYQIALLKAALCNKALEKYQGKHLASIAPVMKTY